MVLTGLLLGTEGTAHRKCNKRGERNELGPVSGELSLEEAGERKARP